MFLQLHLIALNEPHNGRLRGIRGADLLCHREARESGMNGTFRAFLSSSDQNLDSLVYYPIDRNVPIVNSKVAFYLLGTVCNIFKL